MRKTFSNWKWKKAANIFICGIFSATILIAGCADNKTSAAVAEKPAPAKAEQQLSSARNTPIVQAAKKVGPAVVGIATKAVRREVVPDLADLFPGFPFGNLPGDSGALYLQSAPAGVMSHLGSSTAGLPLISGDDVWVLRNRNS